MMRSLLVIATTLVLVSAITAATASGLGPCNGDATIAVNETSGQLGCNGVTGQKTITWNFSNDKTRIVNIGFGGYTGSTVTIRHANRPITVMQPGQSYQVTFAAGGVGQIIFYTGPYTVGGYGVTIDMKPFDTPYQLTSGQTYNLQKEQQGGFVYFSLPWNGEGKMFSLDVKVFSYQGLQSPSVYVSVDTIPTLEKYSFTNATVPIGSDTEECILYKNDPQYGIYYIGVFLYGSTARISINAQWTYKIQQLTSGVKVAATTDSIVYYQLTVPVNAPSLKFQISRQVPGGYPVAYVTQGTLPAAFNYEWIADTNTQSYIAITINNPNPAGSGASNPGNYLIAVTAPNSSGYILQCNW